MLKRLSHSSALLCAAGALFLLCSQASAATIITLEQAGSDVVGTVSGSIDLDGLTYLTFVNGGAANIDPSDGEFTLDGGSTDEYQYFSGPISFGSGGATYVSSQSGDQFTISGSLNVITLPSGYVSGTPLSATATWDNTTLSALGVTPGTYTWTWGAGAHADSITLYAGVEPPAATPEPGSLLLLSAGLIAFGGFALRKSRAFTRLK